MAKFAIAMRRMASRTNWAWTEDRLTHDSTHDDTRLPHVNLMSTHVYLMMTHVYLMTTQVYLMSTSCQHMSTSCLHKSTSCQHRSTSCQHTHTHTSLTSHNVLYQLELQMNKSIQIRQHHINIYQLHISYKQCLDRSVSCTGQCGTCVWLRPPTHRDVSQSLSIQCRD